MNIDNIDTMNTDILLGILDKHHKWLCSEKGGERADLSGADLGNAYLRGACLSWANLTGANLGNADLRDAYLTGANLGNADLGDAYLNNADLINADLRGAYLSGANLRGADLRGADLKGACLNNADLINADLRGACLIVANLTGTKIEKETLDNSFPICCPEYGSFIAWKKAENKIIKLRVTDDAKRSSAFGRKCRCSKAMCLSIEEFDGSDSGLTEISSDYDKHFVYRVGEIAEVEDFDDDRTHECAPGIHFFITRNEAVRYE